MTCRPRFCERSLELGEVTPQTLDLQTDHPILKLDRGEFGRELRRVAAAVHVGRVNVDRTDAQVGHRAVLGVEQVARVRRRPERRGQRPRSVSNCRRSRNSILGIPFRRGFLWPWRRFCPSSRSYPLKLAIDRLPG